MELFSQRGSVTNFSVYFERPKTIFESVESLK